MAWTRVSNRQSRFERLGDTDLSSEKRVILVALIALIASVGTISVEFLLATSANMTIINLAWQVLLLCIFVGIFRHFKLEETENNRLIFVIILAALVAQLIVTCCALMTDIPLATMHKMYTAVWMTCAVVATLAMGWIYMPSTVAAIGVVVIVALWPRLFYIAVAGGTLLMAINFLAAYRLKIKPRSLMG